MQKNLIERIAALEQLICAGKADDCCGYSLYDLQNKEVPIVTLRNTVQHNDNKDVWFVDKDLEVYKLQLDFPAPEDIVIKAANGLQKNPDDGTEVWLGGTLLHGTTIDQNGFALNIVNDSLGSANGVNMTSNSINASGNSSKMLNVTTTGTNILAAQTTYGIFVSNTHDGTTSRDIGIYAEAVGGISNFAGYFNQQIRLCDPTIEGQRLDIFGGNPSAISGFGANMIIQMNTVTHAQFQTDFVKWNGQGVDLNYQFRICSDEENNLFNAQVGVALAHGSMIGINQEPTYTLDVRTKYLARHASDIFYASNWVGKRYFAVTDPIPVSVVGFGVGHRFQLENSSELLFEAARLDFVTTNIVSTTEAVDMNISLVAAGAVARKFTVKSTGAIQTVQPSGTGAGLIKLGKMITATTALDTTKYWEIEVDGVIVKVGIVTSS